MKKKKHDSAEKVVMNESMLYINIVVSSKLPKYIFVINYWLFISQT